MDSYKRGLLVTALIILFVFVALTGFSLRRRPVTEQQIVNNDVETPLDSKCETFDQRQYCSADYTNLSEEQAREKAEADGLAVRVVLDNQNPDLAVTDDYQAKRINFFVRDGLVYKAEFY